MTTYKLRRNLVVVAGWRFRPHSLHFMQLMEAWTASAVLKKLHIGRKLGTPTYKQRNQAEK